MELLEGDTLREKLDAGPLPQRKALDYALQIAQGLAAAHERGIVHRDLKPQNLFVTRDGIVKILDFGLVKRRLEPSGGENSSAPTTPRHPHRDDPGDGRLHVPRAGPRDARRPPLRHLRARRGPLRDADGRPRLPAGERRRDDDVDPARRPAEASPAGRALPPEIAEIVGHCLEKSPDERFQSARDLALRASGRRTGGSWPFLGAVRQRSALRRLRRAPPPRRPARRLPSSRSAT